VEEIIRVIQTHRWIADTERHNIVGSSFVLVISV